MCYSSLCIFLVTIPVVISQVIRDPCGDRIAQGFPCYHGQECRLVQPNFCFQQPCKPEPICVQKLRDLRTCRIGAPVLDVNNRPLTCFRGQNCPPTTTCNTEVMDVQATCCWTPQGGQPFFPPPLPLLPPQRSNQCTDVFCRVGQVCELRPSINCFRPPCLSTGVCVDQKPVGPGPVNPFGPPPPPQPLNPPGPANPFGPPAPPQPPQPPGAVPPCQVAKCTAGYECKEVPSKCNNPPCPLTAICVKKPTAPTAAPKSQCPVMKGPLNCDFNCELDQDCEFGELCCKHKCGAMCAPPSNGSAAASSHPCDTVTCSAGNECRLRQVNCFRSPCPATASCGPSLPKALEPKCPTGLPATDTSNKELFCGRGFGSQPCPQGTFCNVDPLDRFAVCCHKDGPTISPVPPPATNPCDTKYCPVGQECRVETIMCVTHPCPGDTAVCRSTNKQGLCPTVPPGFGACVAKCTNDADCTGDHKCCGSCPRQCTAPAPNLTPETPGTCPPQSPFPGMCIAECSTDSQCPPGKKCCGNCPRRCLDPLPSSLPPIPGMPAGNPCATMFCPPNTNCVVKHNPCFRRPCPQRGECVPNAPPTKPVSRPGICKQPSGFGNCRNTCFGDSSCPGNQKCCSNGCGSSCQDTITEKTGFCQINTAQGNSTNCQTQCKGDFSCPWDQKCCTQGCTSSCTRPLNSAPYVDSDPCKRQVCNNNQVCKLKQTYCIRPPCQLQPECLAKTPTDSSTVCASGYPVIGMRMGVFTCSSTNPRCPANSVCTKGTCCWDTSTPTTPTVQPECPGLHDSSLWFFCNFYTKCTSHAGCPQGQKCCHASGCGKRCMTLKSK